MAKREYDLKSFSITQFLDLEYWSCRDDYLTSGLLAGNADVILSWVCDRLVNRGWIVSEAYAILHNEDVREKWDTAVSSMVIEKKAPHIHASIRFEKGGNEGANIIEIAKAIGLERNYVEKPKSGRFSWSNQLAYLIHAKDKDKYQYPPEAVFTFKGEDYISIYQESKDMWERGAIAKENKEAKEDVEYLERMILEGRVEKQQVILTDKYYNIYSQYKRRLDDAFDTYSQRKMYKAMKKLQNGEYKTTVYYIMGQSGSGKTSFANEFVFDLINRAKEELNESWTVSKTASTNPVDSYMGEEIVLMDDVRGSSMRADDWLKLLDPWNVSPSSARYRNKTVTARCIIITATMNPIDFFNNAKPVGGHGEAVDQFLRRLMGIIHVIDYNMIRLCRAVESSEVANKTRMLETSRDSRYKIIADECNTLPATKEAIREKLVKEVIANNRLKGGSNII